MRNKPLVIGVIVMGFLVALGIASVAAAASSYIFPPVILRPAN
jgi:hypothetical protein